MASRARADGALRLACALCAVATAGSARVRAADAEAEAEGLLLSGHVYLEYVARADAETGASPPLEDHDIYVGVLADWRNESRHFSGSLYWRGVKDVDGLPSPKDDPFRSAYDAYGGGWYSQLFSAYVDVRADGPVRLARAGRQFLYEGHPFHFDGARLDSQEGPGGLCASAFGGVPVHYFESSREGDWLVGFGVEARPWPGGRVSALYAHVEDDARFFGLPTTSEADDLLVLGASGSLHTWGSAAVRYTAADGDTRDLVVRARAFSERYDALFLLSYYVQPRTLAEFSIDLSAYNLVEGERSPFDKINVMASKRFLAGGDWRIGLEAGGTARRLLDPASEGEYNRDYDVLRLGLNVESSEPRRFGAELAQVWWRSSGDDMSALDAEVRYRANDALDLKLGTTYSLFKYDLLGLAERSDVREGYLKVRWKAAEKTEFRFKYAAERTGESLLHTARLRWTTRF